MSPKEIFTVFDTEHLVIANIASPASARNIDVNSRVCVGFVDVFVQKGFKVTGLARNVKKQDPDFSVWSPPLAKMAGPRFPIHSVFVVQVTAVEPILAPSYRLHPNETSEESQIASAMQTYGVRSARGDAYPSLKPSPNGGPPGPVWRYAVHFRQPGPGVPPLGPA